MFTVNFEWVTCKRDTSKIYLKKIAVHGFEAFDVDLGRLMATNATGAVKGYNANNGPHYPGLPMT